MLALAVAGVPKPRALALQSNLLQSTDCDVVVETSEGCDWPTGLDSYAAVIKWAAHLQIEEAQKGLAIGAELDARQSLSTIGSATGAGKSHIKDMNSVADGWVWSSGICKGNELPFDWERFERIAVQAVPSVSADCTGPQVIVVDQGGEYIAADDGASFYSLDNFTCRDQPLEAEDGGKTLVVFKGAGSVVLKRGANGAQFGPSVLAPFAHVLLDGGLGFLDGQIIAASMGAYGGDAAYQGITLRGNAFTSAVTCDEAAAAESDQDLAVHVPLAIEASPEPSPSPSATTLEILSETCRPWCLWNSGVYGWPRRPHGLPCMNQPAATCSGPFQPCYFDPACPTSTTVYNWSQHPRSGGAVNLQAYNNSANGTGGVTFPPGSSGDFSMFPNATSTGSTVGCGAGGAEQCRYCGFAGYGECPEYNQTLLPPATFLTAAQDVGVELGRPGPRFDAKANFGGGPSPWEVRCLWEGCSGCTSCAGMNTCKTWCSFDSSAWQDKCGWDSCAGCDECSCMNAGETLSQLEANVTAAMNASNTTTVDNATRLAISTAVSEAETACRAVYAQYHDCSADDIVLTFENSTLTNNNLGGQGPDFAGPNTMRYEDVGHIGDEPFDIVVENVTTYDTGRADQKNGIIGQMSNFNIAYGSHLKLIVSFVKKDNTPVQISSFDVGLIDMKTSLHQPSCSEWVSVNSMDGDFSYGVHPNSTLEVIENGTETYFLSTEVDPESDSHVDFFLDNLTDVELRRAVNIRYYDTSAFSFTFGFQEPVVQDGVVHLAGENCKKYNENGTEYGGRNFQFVGYSTTDTCESVGVDAGDVPVPTVGDHSGRHLGDHGGNGGSALRKMTGRRHADVVFERATNKLLLMR